MSRSGYLHIDGQRLEYRRLGPDPHDAPTVVMLHEGLGSVSTWREFPEAIARATGLGVFVYSRAGYGSSSPCALPRPLTYMHDEALDTLPRVLDAIGFRAGLLLGHSDGASIATIHGGARRDRRVRGLVLMAPHFFTEDLGIEAIAEVRAKFETSDLRARLARHHGENVDVAFRGWNDAWLNPAFRRWDIREYLSEIRVPVLVLQGEDDAYGSVAQIETARALCRAPFEALLLPQCGHVLHRDQPQRTSSAVADFAARVLEEPAHDTGGRSELAHATRARARSGEGKSW